MKTIKQYSLLICSLMLFYIFACSTGTATETSATSNQIRDTTTISKPQNSEEPDNTIAKPSDFLWIIGEITLAIITCVFLLAIYSWHLRKVVEDKTHRLKALNSQLEEKVDERTAELLKSKNEYKEMYAHAKSEHLRAKSALQSEREAIKQNLNFIDMISHEYRTPLSILSSSIELIEKKCEINDSHDFDSQINKMNIAIQRLLDIFDSSLRKERVDDLTAEFQTKPINPRLILDSALELTKSAYPDYNIILNDKQYHNQLITGDLKPLVTVFNNILDNACKYSNPDNTIFLTLETDKDWVIIRTTDNGAGIASEELDSVFEKYYRSEHTSVKQGAGIGLYLVKNIIDLHKGKITISSQRGVGTELSVFLPLSEEIVL